MPGHYCEGKDEFVSAYQALFMVKQCVDNEVGV